MTTHTKHQTAQFVEVSRDAIRNAPYNPRSIAPANRKRLTKSLKTHGLVDAPVWNKTTGNLVGGHQRLSILDDLEGSKDYSLTVQQVELSEDEEMTLNLALNNKSMQGQFESDKLKDIMSYMIESGVDLESAGYSTTDVQTMYPDIAFAEAISQQQEAEADAVAEISNMVQSGKAHEQEFRDRMGLPPTKAMMGDDVYDENSGHEGQHGSDIADDDPPEHVERGWTEPKEYFENKRQGVVDSNAVKSQTDVMLTLTFQTTDQLMAFMDRFGLDKTRRTVGVTEIEVAFEVQLPPK